MEQKLVLTPFMAILQFNLTFLATKRTTSRATTKQPAAILAVMRFVDASIKAIPQNDEPRSGFKSNHTGCQCHKAVRTT